MSTSLSPRILVVEDRPFDAELIMDELRQAGFTPDWHRVETEEDYLDYLDSYPDLIVADYTLPRFGALQALHLLQERALDIPFIVVSGSIGEDLAVSAMKQGAADYLLKDRLARLGEAVRHVLLQYQLRPEKRQAEQALRASEERFRALIEQGYDVIAVVDNATTVRYVTPSVERLLGYKPDELIGKRGLDFVDPGDIDRAAAALDQMTTSQGMFVSLEFRVLHKDGSSRLVETTGRNLQDVPGVDGIVISFRDITERKRVEESLAQERNLLRTLIDALPDGIYVKDTQSRIVLDNIQNRSNLGQVAKPQETYGKTDFDFHPRALAQQFFDDEQRIIQTGQPMIDYEEPDIDPQGKLGWHLTTKVPLRDSQGQIIGIVGISRDITERKRAEEELRRSETAEREQRVLAEALRDSATAVTSSLEPDVVLRKILENLVRVVPNKTANIALVEGDTARIAFWRGYDPAIELFLGNTRFSLEMVHFHQMLTTQAPILISDTTTYPGWQAAPELSWRRSFAGAPILAHGRVIGFLNVDSAEPGYFTPRHAEAMKAFADQAAIAIENAQLYDQLRKYTLELEARVVERTAQLHRALEHEKELNELKSSFVSIVSHEFRTPLAVIMSSSELLTQYEDRLTPEKKAHHFAQIGKQVRNMIELLNDILDFSKAQSGKLQFNPAQVEVAPLCIEILEPMQVSDAGLHQFTFENHGQISRADLDERLMRHILVNLLSNAIKYSPDGGEIRFELTREDDHLILRVSDQGMGIPRADLPYLFEPFHRAKNASKIQGTGLGMAIVKSNVDAHHGSIAVESQEGVGTTFTVRLPVSAVKAHD